MGKKVYEEENIRAIAEKIREKTGEGTTYKVSEMPGGIEGVYEAGQKSEYDRFWDTFQENGNRTNYELAFAGEGWTDETFKPKYDLTATNNYATQMFWGSNITDLAGMLKKQNVKLITEGCKSPVQMFQNSKIETIPPLDFSSANGSTSYCFASTSLKTIERLKVSENTNFHPQIFSYASALKNIAFEGVIGTDISFKDCKSLTHQSLMSIINALKDFRTYKTYAYNSSISHENISVCPDFYSTITVTNNYSDDYNLRLSGVDENNKEQSIEICFFNGTNDEFYHLAECPLADLEIKTFSCKPFEGAEDIALEYEFTYIKPYIENTTTKTLTLGSTNLEKLTDAEKKIATDKGWTLA